MTSNATHLTLPGRTLLLCRDPAGITLNNGRIGISGRVLFSLNSDQLQPDGR